METSSAGWPLVTLAAFAFAILLSFSSSVVKSQSTPRNSPSASPPPPPPPAPFHTPPPLANKGGTTYPRRPRKGNYWHRPQHHPPHPSAKKHSEPATSNNRGLNKGKLVGLVIAGIVIILQIGVVGFLAYKRNQIYKARD